MIWEVEAWLTAPAEPEPHSQTVLFAKVVLALMLGRPAERYLDAQRAAHLRRMHELTALKRAGSLMAPITRASSDPGEPYPADAGRPPPSRGLTSSILRAGFGPENPGKLGCIRENRAYQRRPRSSASNRAAWVGVISACASGWVRR